MMPEGWSDPLHPGPCTACGTAGACAVVAAQALCGPCLERALLSLVVDGPTRLRLYAFQGLLCVARDAANALRAEIRAGFAARCQADLLAAREGLRSTLGDDDARVTVGVSMSRATHDRVQALADEANLGVAAWVRQAIAYALSSTTSR